MTSSLHTKPHTTDGIDRWKVMANENDHQINLATMLRWENYDEEEVVSETNGWASSKWIIIEVCLFVFSSRFSSYFISIFT